MNLPSAILLLGSCFILPAAFGQTTTIDYTEIFAPASNPLILGGYQSDGVTPNFPTSVSAPAFDSNLGTLDSVTVTLDATVEGNVVVWNYNVPGNPEAFTNATSSADVTVSGPAGTSISAMPTSTVASGIAAGPFGTGTYFTPTAEPAASSSANVDPNVYSSYEIAGGGMLLFLVDSDGGGTFGGHAVNNGQVAFGGNAAVSGDIMVAYTYTVIPEPALYAAMLGAAAVGFAFVRRLRPV